MISKNKKFIPIKLVSINFIYKIVFMNTTIKHTIETSKKIALFWHKNPDWDCIWAMLWLWWILKKMGKDVKYFTPTEPSRIYDFLPWIELIKSEFDYGIYDLILFLDFWDTNRISWFYDKYITYFEKQNIIIIDHHVIKEKNKNWLIISDPSSMSACEVIFETTYQRWPDLYDKQIATYLYLWLTTDSGNFRFDEDHKRILTNALNLVELWADKKIIVNNAFRKKSFAGVKMMELMFKRLQKKWDIIYTRYTEKDIEKSWIDREEADFWQIIIQDIEDAKVSIIFRDDNKNKKCCMSFRSKTNDVQKIAELFWWWWHLHAAGASIDRVWYFRKQVQYLSDKISKMII